MPILLEDIEFAHVGNQSLYLDLHLPDVASTPSPLIVFLYGGGWESANRKRHSLVRRIDDDLLTRGYAIATIDYRMATEAIFPAQIIDCKGAVRWLRTNAFQYNLDPNCIGVYGFSSGAHLAALLGLTAGIDFGIVSKNETVDDRVQAVCTFAVTADFFLPHGDLPDSPTTFAAMHKHLFGGTLLEKRDLVLRANPLSYITPDAPPFLLLHNIGDMRLFPQQSEILYQALSQAGVEATLYLIPEGTHGFRDVSETEIKKVVLLASTFFDRHLRS